MIEVFFNGIKNLFKEKDLKIESGSNHNNNQGNRGTIIQSGRDIVNDFSGNKFKINGTDYSDIVKDHKEINIVINGNIDNLTVDNCNLITVSGDVREIETTNGNVEIEGSVLGNVETTNGNVKANHILGKAKTVNGNIKGAKG